MAQLPSHPASHDDPGGRPAHGAPGRKRRWVSAVWVGIIFVLLLVMVVLHLAGVVGPGSH